MEKQRKSMEKQWEVMENDGESMTNNIWNAVPIGRKILETSNFLAVCCFFSFFFVEAPFWILERKIVKNHYFGKYFIINQPKSMQINKNQCLSVCRAGRRGGGAGGRAGTLSACLPVCLPVCLSAFKGNPWKNNGKWWELNGESM